MNRSLPDASTEMGAKCILTCAILTCALSSEIPPLGRVFSAVYEFVDRTTEMINNGTDEATGEKGIVDAFAVLDEIFERAGGAEAQRAYATPTLKEYFAELADDDVVDMEAHAFAQSMDSVERSYADLIHYVNNYKEITKRTLLDFATAAVSGSVYSVQSVTDKIHSFVSSDDGVLSKKLQQLASLEAFPDDLERSLRHVEQSWVWAKTDVQLRSIFGLYETFRRFQKQQTDPGRIPSPRQAWIDLAVNVLHDAKFSVEGALKTTAEYVQKDHLFLEALKELDTNAMCASRQSPQQLLFNLYNTMSVIELKGYAMTQFSYMLLTLYKHENFTIEPETSREDFKRRSVETAKAVRLAMSKATGDLWRCDPRKYVEGNTYLQVTQLVQGYVQNEVDLNSEGTCRENCAAYTYTKSHSCYQNLYCRQQRRCLGKIYNCRFVDSDMWICPSNRTTHRRYEYIEYENGKVLGRKQTCPRGTTKVDSWWRWLFWHCSYCMCLCDEEGSQSDRYISLREAASNVKDNRVVTGLRFVKKNRIIHLQVQEGELLPHGSIDRETVQWVPVGDFGISDQRVFNSQDYTTLSFHSRSFDLHDLKADAGYVVTGVRFKLLGAHLNFELLTTPFDFATGKLKDPAHTTVYKDNINTEFTSDRRTPITLERPDIPTRTTSPSSIISRSNQFVEMTHTDFDKDAAQTTVPFFDSQPVESEIPVPLSGAGLYLKGLGGFGGFIGPKIVTYDYSGHLIGPLDLSDDVFVN